MSLYVDDILLATNDIELLNKVKIELSEKFEMKDMGEAFYVLGIQIFRDRKSRILSINQEKYLHSILKRFGIQNCAHALTPYVYGKRLNKSQCPGKGQKPLKMPYAQVVKSLMYAMCSEHA